MLELTSLFLLKIIFVIEILIAMFLFSFRWRKRSKPILRIVIAIASCLIISIFFPIFDEVSYSWWYTSLMFLVLFSCCFGAMFLIYDVPWQRIFFVSITAYTIQHFSYEIYTLFSVALNLSGSSGDMYGGGTINLTTDLLPFVLCFTTYVVIYSVMFFFLDPKIQKFDANVNGGSILFISGLILLVDIIFNSIVLYLEEDASKIYSMVICAYNILCCCMIFYIQLKVVSSERAKIELQTAKRLLEQSEERYKESKENVNLINLKCHDLKHQIREYASKGQLNKDTISNLESIISIYDSTVKTNNDVLDLILTEKSLYCQKNNIKLTCLADCSKLSFIDEPDLYSLFGNLIDNAVEAVNKIENTDKRNINLIVRNAKKYVSIAIDNFFIGNIKLDKDGIPITTKDNVEYHGFGMKSVRMIVDKYEGDFKISIKDDIFSVYILFKIE